MTPAQRSMRARAAAYAMHAQGKTRTGPATAAHLARFEREVDPDRVLTPEERNRRAGFALRSYMAKLALKASKKRAASTAKPTALEVDRVSDHTATA